MIIGRPLLHFVALICCTITALFSVSSAEPTVANERLLERFNELVSRARAAEADGREAVIKVYNEAIVDPSYEAFGQIHLKLGQLQQAARRRSEAAYHFSKCIEDHRVDPLDREIICAAGFDENTTTLVLEDMPRRAQVLILEPELFGGPFRSGGRLPMGPVRLVVEVPGHFPHETVLRLDRPKKWRVEIGMKRRSQPLIPDEFLEEAPLVENRPTETVDYSDPPPEAASGTNLPYWIVGGVGLAMVAGGLIVGNQAVEESKDPRKDLETLEQRAATADLVARLGGVLLGGTAVVWYFNQPDTTDAP